MKLTKYGHACVLIENDEGKKVVIDAGEWTELPEDLNNILVVVCTHVHGDHTDARNVLKIVDANPGVVVYANSESMEVLADVECKKVVVDSNALEQIAGFELSFYALDHAVIWQNSPCRNLAMKVNDFYYYPGDSFHIIDEPVEIAGVPVSAPWLKMSEAIQFVYDVKSKKVIPTHNGILNDNGHMIAHNWLNNIIADTGKELVLLKNSESI
jgi:L-ascorbate metabolism protein UlaG (beta-lactamase superfamily)